MPHARAAILTVDLAAIAANYRLVREKSAPALCGAAIKANAYGLGMAAIAPVLAANGCRHFFVANLDEALALRNILPEAAIFILNGLDARTATEIAVNRLTPVLNTLQEVEAWGHFAARQAAPPPAALHIDTGLNRLGLGMDAMAILKERPALLGAFPLSLVLSHLACADQPEHPLNEKQRGQFSRAAMQLPPGQTPLLSLSGSSGVFLSPAYHFGLTRPGAALYGLRPSASQPNPMRPVIRLQAPVLQVRHIDSGMTVGYGATHRFKEPSRVATIGIGYADGIMRTLGNRGIVHFAGQPAPIVGRVSMDLLTVDIGHLPDAAVTPGGYADLIGPEQSADDFATAAGTIGYEILTALGQRYRRVYLPAETRAAGRGGA